MLYQNKSTWIKGLKEIMKPLKYQKKQAEAVGASPSSSWLLFLLQAQQQVPTPTGSPPWPWDNVFREHVVSRTLRKIHPNGIPRVRMDSGQQQPSPESQGSFQPCASLLLSRTTEWCFGSKPPEQWCVLCRSQELGPSLTSSIQWSLLNVALRERKRPLIPSRGVARSLLQTQLEGATSQFSSHLQTLARGQPWELQGIEMTWNLL